MEAVDTEKDELWEDLPLSAADWSWLSAAE